MLMTALAAAAGIHAPAHGFHQNAIRIPMMALAFLGAVINIFVIWKVRNLRSKPASQWRQQPVTQKKLNSERFQIALAVLDPTSPRRRMDYPPNGPPHPLEPSRLVWTKPRDHRHPHSPYLGMRVRMSWAKFCSAAISSADGFLSSSRRATASLAAYSAVHCFRNTPSLRYLRR